MSAPAVVALRRQGAPGLLVAYAEAADQLPIGPDARRLRRMAATRLLGFQPDLEAWMARPRPARLADLRRSAAWPFVAWCFLEGHLRPDLDLLLAKSPGDLYATWAQRHGHDVARLEEVAGRFGWSANWTRDLTAGLAMICLWAGSSLDGLAGADFERFATELASCPSAGRNARAHNGARAYSLHQICYELRVCDCPPRKNMRRAATLAEALTTFARSILDYIESKARANASCIGLSLWVRADNKHARKLYQDLGFKYGANGSFDDDGLGTFEMRKWFAS